MKMIFVLMTIVLTVLAVFPLVAAPIQRLSMNAASWHVTVRPIEALSAQTASGETFSSVGMMKPVPPRSDQPPTVPELAP